MKGFFNQSTLRQTKPPTSSIPKCGACRLYKHCNSPKMAVTGEGRRGILIVAEAPGAEEDKHGIQLVGPAGKYLEKSLRRIGVDMREDCWLTNAIICRPENNRTPTLNEIEYCQPNLFKTIEELKPKVIVPMGTAAVQSLIGRVWKDDVGPIGQWVGFKIPSREPNAWICPVWHPSYMIRNEGKPTFSVQELLYGHQLEGAFSFNKIPWEEDGPPDYNSMVEKIIDHKKAAKVIRKMIKYGGTVAFDYETNMLKPDSKYAQIVSCSVCWEGKKTIAFPWMGEAITAMAELLASPVYKIASNLKFEDRWTIKEFGFQVNNWLWDTMQAAHVIDNRPGITSIKFQSYVHLGVPVYDEHIKPFLRAKRGKKINQILDEIELGDLLLYNGLDSILEYEVAMLQMKEMGV